MFSLVPGARAPFTRRHRKHEKHQRVCNVLKSGRFVYVIHIVPSAGSKAKVWQRSPCHHTPPLWAYFLKCQAFFVDSQAEVWWRSPCNHTPPAKGVLPYITRKIQSAVHPIPPPYIPHHPRISHPKRINNPTPGPSWPWKAGHGLGKNQVMTNPLEQLLS